MFYAVKLKTHTDHKSQWRATYKSTQALDRCVLDQNLMLFRMVASDGAPGFAFGLLGQSVAYKRDLSVEKFDSPPRGGGPL